MTPRHGIETARFGEWLTARVAGLSAPISLKVFYDHGDKRRHSNVAAVKGFVGQQTGEVSNVNRLAHLDLMVTLKSNALLLIEIEERPLSPKKLLGDVLAVLLCNRFAVLSSGRQQYFDPTPHTRLLIAGTVPDRGHRLTKVKEVLTPRIAELSGAAGGMDPCNVRLIFSRSLPEALETLKAEALSVVTSLATC